MTESSLAANAASPLTTIILDPPTARIPRRVRLLIKATERFKVGRIEMRFPNGHRLIVQGCEPGPQAIFEIRRMKVFRRVLLGGHLAFAESYLDGDWDSPDVADLLHYFLANEQAVDIEGTWLTRLFERLRHFLNSNSRTGSRRNIAYHYDLGNAFYREWLDPSMTYSSAVFAGGANDLEAAQREKYKRMADLAGIGPGSHVLEIGCGWGGFAEYAIKERGATLVGLTLSKEQLAFARARLDRQGLGDKADLRLQDYRDVTGTFDAVVSIEMIEAVGEQYWPTYFSKIFNVLRDGGKAAIQAILIADHRYDTYVGSPDFIQRYIFPGGMLPSPGRMRDQVTRAGLKWLEDHGYGLDYARTLRDWLNRFDAAWPRILGHGESAANGTLAFDERFRRMWRYYLYYCEAGFRFGSIDVRQVGLQR